MTICPHHVNSSETITFISMQQEKIQRDSQVGQSNNFREPLQSITTYGQTKYRWIILALASMMMVLNGLLNNIIIPIESKLAKIYSLDSKIVNMATILSFLAFLLVNMPANYILDKRGIKFGFMVGNGIYLAGIILSCCINAGFPFVIGGYLIFVMGQPFILNIPAKIATYWFFPENRALATSIMVGSNIIGSGVGFAVPALVVKEDSEGEYAKRQIFSLYIGYAITTLVMLIINFLFMKSAPSIPPSKIDRKQSLTIKQTYHILQKDRNLWKFFGAFWLFYGTFLIFGSSSNFLIKAFDYSDLMISLAAVGLILFGSVGAIISSIFIKKTRKYKMMITITTFSATAFLLLMTMELLIIPLDFITLIITAFVGFFVVPVVPASYQIGCQLAFPIGEAQVVGILNGGALFWAFIMDSILTAAIGFGTKTKTIVFMFVLILFLITGAIVYLKTAIILKRKEFQESMEESSSPETSRTPSELQQPKEIQMTATPEDNTSTAASSYKPEKYSTLVQERNA